MNRSTLFEILSALVFCVVAVLIINPAHFWMPSMAHTTMLAIAAAAFGAFVVFVLKERAADEREERHRALAGHIAFLCGSAVLLIGIALQSESSTPDPWLLYALIAMVLGKVAARLWSEIYR